MSENVYIGKVVWFGSIHGKYRGFGFISWFKDKTPQKDIFVHYSDIIEQDGFKQLKTGQEVQFEIGKNLKGQDKAINVKVLK